MSGACFQYLNGRFVQTWTSRIGPTIPVADVCVEVQARPPESYKGAASDCASTDNRERAGRRLPTHQVLMEALAQPQIQLAAGGELTGEVYPSGTPGKLEVLYVSEENGAVGLVPEDTAKSFRCVADPMN